MRFFAEPGVYGLGLPVTDFWNCPAVIASFPLIWSATRAATALTPHDTGKGTPVALLFID